VLGYGLDNMVFESLQKYDIFLVFQKLQSGYSAPTAPYYKSAVFILESQIVRVCN